MKLSKRLNKRYAAIVIFSFLLFVGVFLSQGISSRAEVLYENSDTGYIVLIEDDADLLSNAQIRDLAKTMEPITAYGNVGFKSVSYNAMDTDDFAADFYAEKFGKKNGTLFVIDMDNRYLWIHSDGKVYQTVTKSYANTITDNVYRYASAENYFDCANEAFTQINALLEGDRIMQPMKYICNILLAAVLALMINFAWISWFSRSKKPSTKEVLYSLDHRLAHTLSNVSYSHETRVYSPRSSGSSSGGGGRSGGGGGGGRSGGGGGHRF